LQSKLDKMQELKIITEKENPLFSRKEISLEVQEDKTPSRMEVLDSVSKKLSCPMENIKIKNIGGRFGSKTFRLDVFVYDSAEDKEKIEAKKKKDEALKESLSKPAEPVEEEKPSEETAIAEETKPEENAGETKEENNSEEKTEETKNE